MYTEPYAFTDGSFDKNTSTFGYGGFLIANGKEYIIQGSSRDPELAASWNVAGETCGAMAAIEKAKELGLKELTIYYDYMGVEKWATGEWKTNKEVSRRYRNYVLGCGIKLSFVHVKGHSGIPGNERADKLAREAALGLEKKIFDAPIVLASNSPRRREILTQGGYEYLVDAREVDENIGISDPVALAEELSLRKAMAVADSYPDRTVIGADTVVALESEILGKPKDKEDAFHMLKKLSGVTHSVVTGVTVIYPGEGENREKKTFHEITGVSFYELSDDEIKSYIATGEPMDKAGAYGIQGRGALFVERISGDYLNVVGLPLARLARYFLETEM